MLTLAAAVIVQAAPPPAQWWHKFVTWPEGIATWALIFTLGAIVWQAIETRRSVNASRREFIANQRPKLLVKHVWLIPGRFAEIEGTRTLQDHTQWSVGCTLANVGGSDAEVIDSSLTISRLGVGSLEGLLPPLPPYDTQYNFGRFRIRPGERQEQIVVLDANQQTMQLRLAHTTAEHRRDKGLAPSATTPIVCFGFFRYMDNNEVARLTGFGWSWNALDMGFIRLDDSNYEYAD